jgi:hypothetical protein
MIDETYSFPSEQSIFFVLPHTSVLEKIEDSRAGTELDVCEGYRKSHGKTWL